MERIATCYLVPGTGLRLHMHDCIYLDLNSVRQTLVIDGETELSVIKVVEKDHTDNDRKNWKYPSSV